MKPGVTTNPRASMFCLPFRARVARVETARILPANADIANGVEARFRIHDVFIADHEKSGSQTDESGASQHSAVLYHRV
jgi:hypothetical protein